MTPSVVRAKEIELEAVQTAENGDLDRSLELLKEAMEIAPNYASLYNNRAQVRACLCVTVHACMSVVEAFCALLDLYA